MMMVTLLSTAKRVYVPLWAPSRTRWKVRNYKRYLKFAATNKDILKSQYCSCVFILFKCGISVTKHQQWEYIVAQPAKINTRMRNYKNDMKIRTFINLCSQQ
jgi:hypothetical protein